VLCGKEENTEGIGGVRNENHERQILVEECRWGWRSTHSSGGASKWVVTSWESISGAPIPAEKHKWGLRSAFPAEERQKWVGGG